MPRDEALIVDRFRRALLALQKESWAEPEQRVDAAIRTAALSTIEAYEAYTAAGLVADATDRWLVKQAQRYLAKPESDPAT